MRSVAFAVALLISTTVFAGTVTVQDDTNLFRALGQVESKAGDWPFDTRIVISDRAPNKSAFESQVANQVVGPKVLAIGISPAHKFTVVRFGKGLHIPPDAWNSIFSSGNAAFKVGEYGLGIINIADTVKGNMVQVTERPTYTTVTKSYTIEPEPVHPAWYVVPIGLMLFMALLIGLVIRKRAKERAQQERLRLAEEAADRIIAQDFGAQEKVHGYSRGHSRSYSEPVRPAVYYPPADRPQYQSPIVHTTSVIQQPTPVIVHDSGNSLVTGMLLNEAIHSHHSHYEPEHHHHAEREVIRETVHETPSSSSGGSSSWSESSPSSGSSSSWGSSSDDSSGSSSSYDSGSSDSGSSGGSSDW